MNFRDQDERSKKRETKGAELSNMTFFGLIVARPKNSNTKALSALALQRATFVILKGAIRSCPHYQRRPLLSQAGVTLILLTRARHRAALPGCSLCFINVSSYATSRRAPITPSRSINFSLSLSLSLFRSHALAPSWPYNGRALSLIIFVRAAARQSRLHSWRLHSRRCRGAAAAAAEPVLALAVRF